MQKERTILLLTLILAVVWSLPAFGAAAPKYRMNDLKHQLLYSRYAGANDGAQAFTASRPSWNSSALLAAVPPGTPGYQVGETTYDYQHNGSTGRQVDVANGIVQCVWMKGTQNTIAVGRTVFWNKRPMTGSAVQITLDNGDTLSNFPLGTPGSINGTELFSGATRLGYPTFRNMTTGQGVAFVHDAPDDSLVNNTGVTAVAFGPGAGVFGSNYMVQHPDVAFGNEAIWLKGATQLFGGNQYVHAVARGSSTLTYDPIYYWRGLVTGAAVAWEDPIFIDSTGVIGQIVEAEATGSKVAIAWPKPINMDYELGAAQSFNNIVYIESTNGGQDWSAEQYVTNQDTLTAGNFAYTDVDAVYDEDGTLHVVYNTRDYSEDDGGELVLSNIPARLWHWNNVRGTSRLIVEANYSNSCNEEGNPFTMGAWNLLIAKPNISVKPIGASPVGDPHEFDEVLYTVWVQAGPTDSPYVEDCATQSDSVTVGGYVNNEIWLSGSSDDGLTWDRPKNITGTNQGNDCTPGNCNSEHWVTAADRADSGIFLSYVNDTHAGGIPQDEGAWSTSQYMLYVPVARELVPEPRITAGPISFLELHVTESGEDTVDVVINNLGNSDLTYTMEVLGDGGGTNYVTLLDGGSGVSSITASIAAAANPHTVPVIVYGGGGALVDPSEHDWRVEITSNDRTNNPDSGGSPIYIDLNVFVATDWFACGRDTLSTGTRRLSVSSCLELGNQGSNGGLFGYTLEDAYIFDASPVLTYNPGSGAVAYRDIFMDGVSDRSRDSNQSFRAQSDITVDRNLTLAVGDTSYTVDRATGTATSTDSIFQLDWEVRTIKNSAGLLSDGMVAKYTISEWPGAPAHSGGVINFGAAADLDIDSLSSYNRGIADDVKQYIGAQGGYGDDDIGAASYTPQQNFAALFYIPLDTGCAETAHGGQVFDNVDYIYEENGYHTDSLAAWMGIISGWNAATMQADTITDVNVMMRVDGPLTWVPGNAGTFEFAFGMAVSSVSQSDLYNKIARLRTSFNPKCKSGCVIQVPGDVNETGNITAADIIYLVGFVFKGGPPPVPCAANGDVDCKGTVTAADIIYLVNHVFKGGPAPCDICNEPTAMVCTP